MRLEQIGDCSPIGLSHHCYTDHEPEYNRDASDHHH